MPYQTSFCYSENGKLIIRNDKQSNNFDTNKELAEFIVKMEKEKNIISVKKLINILRESINESTDMVINTFKELNDKIEEK